MKDLAFYFKEDIDKWVWQDCSMTLTAKNGGRYFKAQPGGAEILESLDIESSIIYAVKATMIIMVLKEKERLTRLYTVPILLQAYNCRSFDSSFKKIGRCYC